jgi:hypothetical protein
MHRDTSSKNRPGQRQVQHVPHNINTMIGQEGSIMIVGTRLCGKVRVLSFNVFGGHSNIWLDHHLDDTVSPGCRGISTPYY